MTENKKTSLNLSLEPMSRTRLISIGDAFAISGGLSATRAELGRNGLCYLHYGDIHASSKTTLDTEIDYNDIPKLDIPLSRVTTTSRLLDGDVVFVDASEDDEGTSRYVVIQNNKGIPFIAGLHTIVAKPKIREFDTSYLCYVFSSRFVKRQFIHYAVGTKVSGVNKKTIQNILIPCPSLNIQRHIGLTLAHIDRQVESIKRLISKQEAIKKGTLKLLLTPKPGWKTVKLGDVAEVITGATPSTQRPEYWNGTIPWLSSGEIRQKYISITAKKISQKGFEAASTHKIPRNSILIALAGQGTTRGLVAVNEIELCTNQSIASIIPHNSINYLFLFHNLFSRYDELREASSGDGGRGGITVPILKSFEIIVPKPYEQQNIANALTKLDNQIAVLQTQLVKAQQLKGGMMRYFFG